MNEDRYIKVRTYSNYQIFTFVSTGRHGSLFKIVRFDELYNGNNIYNLSLGTITADGKVDYETITNNGDRNKILATVAYIINIFIEKNPGKAVYLTGSDDRRTVLYHRAISYAYDELKKTFNIYGDISLEDEPSEFELFDKSKNYSGFLVESK